MDISQQYDLAPVLEDRAIPAWRSLIREVERRYQEVKGELRIIPVENALPYRSAQAMNADIARGRMLVSVLNNEHPIWTPDQNFQFRVVHDYDAHFLGNCAFSLVGERQSFCIQAERLRDSAARPALLVEVYGQAAASVRHRGVFQVQKVFLPIFHDRREVMRPCTDKTSCEKLS
jgi:hypothetical protein